MSSEWRRDPASTNPTGNGWLINELRSIKQQIRALAARASINNATMTGLMKVLGDLVVSGQVRSSDFEAGQSGWRLTEGNAEFNNITLRGGIIGNEALANPVRGDVMMANATGFAVPRTFTTLASQTWQVPAGFTRVAVSVLAKVFAYNPTSGLDYLYARTRIVRVSDGADIVGNATPTAASGSNGSATGIAPGVGVIVFPPGDSLRLEVQAMTAFAAWATNPGNGAEIAGSLTWYR